MLDNFKYGYYHGTNRLWHTAADEGDNYQYDPIGNLIADVKEGVRIDWNPYGKVRNVSKSDNTSVKFRYDAAGNRIAKITDNDSTIYVRDASGNVMGIYKNGALTEQSIYGSSRLGLHLQASKPGYRTLGHKQYELSNHLGNVLATIRDRIQLSSDSTWAQVSNISDYYPFGLAMEGRSLLDSSYRYGFQGQEKVDEISGAGNHYTAEYWEMDPRLGRRWNLDPVYKHWISNYSVFGNNPILYIDPNGADWFKNKAGDVKWDDSRNKSIGKGKNKWSNIGSTINIETESGINEDNDTPFPFPKAFSGAKLQTNISITGNYDDEGNFTGFSYNYKKEVFGTFGLDALQGVDYPGKPNTPQDASGSWSGAGNLNFSAHVTTPDIETFGLKLIGRNVDVNQEISFSLGTGGLLNVGINHGTYPSMSMNVYGSTNSEMINFYRYQQHSFISTHATKFWSRAAPLIGIKGGPVGAAFLIDLRLRQNRALMLHQSLNKEYKETNKTKFGVYND